MAGMVGMAGTWLCAAAAAAMAVLSHAEVVVNGTIYDVRFV